MHTYNTKTVARAVTYSRDFCRRCFTFLGFCFRPPSVLTAVAFFLSHASACDRRKWKYAASLKHVKKLFTKGGGMQGSAVHMQGDVHGINNNNNNTIKSKNLR